MVTGSGCGDEGEGGGGEGDGVAQCTQPARAQVAAGYAHHSGATTLVLAVGDEGAAVEFVLDCGARETRSRVR